MRLLLDTHILIWLTASPERLPKGLLPTLLAPANSLFLSAASVWEIAIKRALRRLDFPLDELDSILARAGVAALPVGLAHAVAAGALPRLHQDPFDRMLVAQAQAEDMTLVTDDAALRRYAVPVLPARRR